MAVYYVRSTTGNNTNNGTTWALAKATIAGALAIAAAGDTIYVSQVHAESTSIADITITSPGVAGNGVQIICVNDGAQPPTTLATSATVSSGGDGFNLVIAGYCYCYGISFISSLGSILLAATSISEQVFEKCTFRSDGSNVGSTILIGTVVGCRCTWYNCDVHFTDVSQGIKTSTNNCFFRWSGGSLLVGGTSPTNLFLGGTNGEGNYYLENVDLSNASSSIVIFGALQAATPHTIRNCLLPSGWTGGLASITAQVTHAESIASDTSGNITNSNLQISDLSGTTLSETTVVRVNGAGNGITPISWKMITDAVPSFTLGLIASPEMIIWNDTTGSAKTLTVEFIHDSVTQLKDSEIWLEVIYLGTSAAPLGTWVDDSTALLATPANQAGSTATWVTTGLTRPNAQSLSVTVTPQLKGPIICRVYLAKPSYTVYVDSYVTVT